MSNFHPRNGNLYMCTKFGRNRIIHGRDIEIKLFSKWRPFAILNLQKLQFWSLVIHRHVIIHLCSKFRVDRPIWHRDIAKKTIFNMASVRHLEFEEFRFLSNSRPRNGNLHRRTKSDRNRIILG